ncbi:MAG: glucose 1-dehydrogenase [Acidobacteria bacterium]|nr:glucose 1-dehydrogenase [Acidobacteriota bacterium]MBV9147881.1 glucose 1-dehydrogenase [Acidobacteriota bacterium]MBV9435811.1 glucose 1-dehydrogenase [Acidobacteriota bacterium]
MGKLNGKVALVTGASKGIGAAIAKGLAAEGAAVVVNYRSDKAGAEKVVGEITKAGGKAKALAGDVAKAADVKKIFGELKTNHPHIDILVNNAGVYEFAPIEQFSEESFRRQFDTNVLGTLLATKEALPFFNGSGGSIINLSSVVSITPPANGSVYSATKSAVDTITRSLAQELGPRKIRVNSLAPGFTETEGLKAFAGENPAEGDFGKYAVSRTPLGRVGHPQDIAKAAVFLASDDAAWITGEVLPVGGGARL